MGWSSGNDIFSPVAGAVLNSACRDRSATQILTVLARALMRADWDTADEMAEEFEGNEIVIDALRAAGAFPCEDTQQEYEHEGCSQHAECQR